MKFQHKAAIGLIVVSWIMTSSLWLMQKASPEGEMSSDQPFLPSMERDYVGQGRDSQHEEEGVPEKVLAKAKATIKAQLDAFKRDDYPTAMQYQGKELRDTYDSTAKFRAIIRSTFPQIAHYKSVEFGRYRRGDFNKRLAIRTFITGTDDVILSATYVLGYENNMVRIVAVRRIFTTSAQQKAHELGGDLPQPRTAAKPAAPERPAIPQRPSPPVKPGT